MLLVFLRVDLGFCLARECGFMLQGVWDTLITNPPKVRLQKIEFAQGFIYFNTDKYKDHKEPNKREKKRQRHAHMVKTE